VSVYLYAWVEDRPSAEVARALVRYTNKQFAKDLRFRAGFPAATGGYGHIKKNTPAYLKIARNGFPTLIVTDLDSACCPPTLIRDWLKVPPGDPLNLPKEFIFRVAV